jgi:hypothetical protein
MSSWFAPRGPRWLLGVAAIFLIGGAPLARPAGAAGWDAAGNPVGQLAGSALRPSLRRLAAVAHVPLDVSGTHYVYVNNGAVPNSISGYQATSTGLVPLPGSPYPTGGTGGGSNYGANQLALSPDHQCLFASDAGGGTFDAFAIDADGTLTQVAHVAVEAAYPEGVAVAPQGGVVFVGIFNGYSSGLVDSFRIGAGCAISEAQSLDIGSAMGDVAVTADGSQLFVSSYTGSFINSYAISGATLTLLQSNATNPPADGLVSVADYLFSGDVTADSSETNGYTFTANGQLTMLPGYTPTDPGSGSAAVWLDRVDQQLITAEQFSNSFGLYTVVNGIYTWLGHATGAGTNTPTAMTQLGRYLLVTNDANGTISPCQVGPGTVSCLAPIALPVLGDPNGIVSF